MLKTMAAQMTLLLKTGGRRSNGWILFKFALMLIFLFVLFSVLFHVLMMYEGRYYSWITGFYWTLTTMSTLGFGDITFHSDLGRLFSIVVLFSGIVFLLVMLPFTFIQFFYAPWLEAQNKSRAPRSIPETTAGHVILTHFDAVAVTLIEKLEQYGIPYVVLVLELQQALDLHDRGYRVVVGELDDPETYRRLNIEQAAMVVVLNDDIASTNIIYTIREISDRVITVTNADLDDSLDILQLAGSTHVFQFTRMLGRALSRRVLGVRMQSNIVGRFDELLIAEVPAMRTWLQGKTMAESRLREKCGVTAVGVWEQGMFIFPLRTPVFWKPLFWCWQAHGISWSSSTAPLPGKQRKKKTYRMAPWWCWAGAGWVRPWRMRWKTGRSISGWWKKERALLIDMTALSMAAPRTGTF